MSAFVVDKAHINVMVNAGMVTRYGRMTWYHNGERHELNYNNASAVGQMLMDECIKSVSARYADCDVTSLPGRADSEYLIPFQHITDYHLPSPVQILKLISCYEYQSCEHEEWESSEAKVFCEALRHLTIYRLPGYEEAKWEWTTWPDPNIIRII